MEPVVCCLRVSVCTHWFLWGGGGKGWGVETVQLAAEEPSLWRLSRTVTSLYLTNVTSRRRWGIFCFIFIQIYPPDAEG